MSLLRPVHLHRKNLPKLLSETPQVSLNIRKCKFYYIKQYRKTQSHVTGDLFLFEVSPALHPDDPLPELSPLIASYLERPKALEVTCQASVEKCNEKFKLVRVEKKDKEKADENLFKE